MPVSLTELSRASSRAAEAFAGADGDRNRKLTFDEFKGMHDDTTDPEALQQWFEQIDSDGSGTIDMAEYIRASLLGAIHEAHVRAVDLFKAWDADGSHRIDRREFYRGLRGLGFDCRKDDVDLLFSELSKGQGEISLKDLTSFISGELVERSKSRLRESASQEAGAAISMHFQVDESSNAPPVRDQIAATLSANLQKVSTLFRNWDVDQSGTIDRKEFRMGMRALGVRASKLDLDASFDSFDLDGSGKLEQREFIRALRGVQADARRKSDQAVAHKKHKKPPPADTSSGAPSTSDPPAPPPALEAEMAAPEAGPSAPEPLFDEPAVSEAEPAPPPEAEPPPSAPVMGDLLGLLDDLPAPTPLSSAPFATAPTATSADGAMDELLGMFSDLSAPSASVAAPAAVSSSAGSDMNDLLGIFDELAAPSSVDVSGETRAAVDSAPDISTDLLRTIGGGADGTSKSVSEEGWLKEERVAAQAAAAAKAEKERVAAEAAANATSVSGADWLEQACHLPRSPILPWPSTTFSHMCLELIGLNRPL